MGIIVLFSEVVVNEVIGVFYLSKFESNIN